MTPEALIETLTKSWAHGEHAALDGVTVDAPVTLDGLTLRSFDASNASFNGGVSARAARFRGMAWFRHAHVHGVLDLSGAWFRSDLRLDGVRCDRLILNGARFEGVLTLDHAQLGTLEARDCLCLANLSMAGTQVSGRADLSGSSVMGGIWAQGAAFGQLDLTDCEADGRQAGLHTPA